MANIIPREVIVRDATEADLPFMNEVYNWNVTNSTGILYMAPLNDEYRLKWFRSLKSKRIKGEPYPCLLGLIKGPEGEEISFGYVCYLPWGVEGEEFEHVAKISMYIAQAHTGHGFGADLLTAVLAHRSTEQLRGIVAVITTENHSSMKFFSKHGFIYSGQLNKIGRKFGRLLDVAYRTLYLPSAVPIMTAQLESKNRSIEMTICHDASETIICRDVQGTGTDHLTWMLVNDIHNARSYYLSINSFGSAINMQERYAWYERLGSKSNFPYPAILAEAAGQTLGYAYLAPISDKPGYDISAGLHLASSMLSATDQLLNAILSHPLNKAFRVISVSAIGSEQSLKENLLARGFKQAIGFHELVQRNGHFEDMSIYTLDLRGAL